MARDEATFKEALRLIGEMVQVGYYEYVGQVARVALLSKHPEPVFEMVRQALAEWKTRP